MALLCWLSCTCVVLGLIVLAPVPAEGGYEKTCSPERMREGPVTQTLCGSRLTDAISSICEMQGFRVTHNRRKRHEPVAHPGLKDILVNRREALDYLGKRGNGLRRTGVVCECCYHRCNINELMEYCVDETTKRSPPMIRQTDDLTADSAPSLGAADHW